MNDNIKSLISICIIILCIGGCYHYFNSQPDCIKMVADGSVHCSCEFNTRAEWNKFKNNTGGFNGWEAVAFPNGYDPCKVIKDAYKTSSTPTNDEPTNQELVAIPQHQTVIQDSTPITTNKSIIRNQKQEVDSLPLFREPRPGEPYMHYISHKLPITYLYQNEKYIIYKADTALKVRCYLNDSLYNTFNLKQYDTDLHFVNANALFQYDMETGKMIIAFPNQHAPKQLYLSKTEN